MNTFIKEMPSRISNALFFCSASALLRGESHNNLTIMSTDYVRLNA